MPFGGRSVMLFFDALDQLSVDQELKSLFEEVEVVKVIASKQNKNIYICIRSSRLIHRGYIKKMEELLNRQLFLHTGNKAIIKPQFELSAQYTLNNLYPIYQESILEEIKEQSVVSHHILSSADITIEDMNLSVKVTDNCVVRDKMTKLKDYLETMFQERFDYTVRVNVEYLEPKENETNHEQEYRKQMLRMSEKEALEEGFQVETRSEDQGEKNDFGNQVNQGAGSHGNNTSGKLQGNGSTNEVAATTAKQEKTISAPAKSESPKTSAFSKGNEG